MSAQRKLVAAIALAAASALTLAGCGTTTSEAASEAQTCKQA